MLRPPLPVKSNAFEAVLFDAIPQFGEITVATALKTDGTR